MNDANGNPVVEGEVDPVTGWPTITEAHATVHMAENKANLQAPEFYTEANKDWHPLLTDWAATLKPLSAPDPPTVGEKCVHGDARFPQCQPTILPQISPQDGARSKNW